MPDLELETPEGLARHAFRAMGTQVTVLAPAAWLGAAASLVEALFADWETTLSRFRPDSELSRLNRVAGREALVGDLLLAVTRRALEAAEATDGVFDPTLLGQLVAAGYDRSFELVPASREGRPADRSTAGEPAGRWREVRIDPFLRSITLPPGVGLDLGGIAKGMAVDAAVTALVAAGIVPCVVEAGGDLAVHGVPTDGTWPVAVETGETTTTVLLGHGALATSSIRRRRWLVDGELRHHLIDPRTGRPAATDLLSVTVAAASCQQAEVAAKCALILGAREGSTLLRRLGLSGLIVTAEETPIAVGGWTLDTETAA